MTATAPRVQPAHRTEILRLPALREYQLPVLTSPARDDLTISAPQLGKTTVGEAWLLAVAWRGGPGEIPWSWFAPTHGQCEHGFKGLAAMARSAGILRGEPTTTPPFRLTLKNGAQIQARSWDRPELLYGPPTRGGVVDEFGQLTPDAYAVISSRRAETISRGEGRLVYLGNVGDVGGTAESLYRAAESGAAGFACRRWTWRDRASAHACRCGAKRSAIPVALETVDGHRPDCGRGQYVRFIARERSRLSASEFRRLYEAEWLDGTSLPAYEAFDRSTHVVERVALQAGLPLILSCDFNVDPMAWVVMQHHQHEAWIIDELVIAGGATTERACKEFIRRYPDKTLEVVVYGDSSGRARKTSATATDYEIIRSELGKYYHRLSVRESDSNPPVSERVAKVNAFLRSADGAVKLHIHPRCKFLVRDFSRVSWRPGTREIDKRDKSLTHFSDAAGYALWRLGQSSTGGIRGGQWRPSIWTRHPNPAFEAF
ncbi:MAG TPA: hypothetical protein VFV19_03000 [Candidatus Polarisedimenticolaceae bacterium]|nr:hypothetical protein [Candidatus Polarisedimenticolaceae bacterium]